MEITKTFGPYDSQKTAMRRNCQISMKGTFAGGRYITVDGALMVSTGCTARRDSQADGWIATVTLRPATEAEINAVALTARKEAAQREYDFLLTQIAGSWQSTDPVTMAQIGRANALKAEIDQFANSGRSN